jgi:signal transduction histidine kinase
VHPQDLEGVLQRREIILKEIGASYWEDEYRFLKADGKMAFVQDKGFIIRNAQGVAIRMIGATQDITHRKEFLNELLRVQQNMDALINNTSDMIWSYNTRMELIVGNQAFLDGYKALTGEPVEEGMPILSDVLPYHIIEYWRPLYQRSLKGETFTSEQVYYEDMPDDELYYMISFTPIRNEKEEVVGAACFARNITELRKAYRKLEEMNQELLAKAEELSASNADLERFAFIASHDLQEPLRMVSSFLQLLRQRYQHQLDKKAESYIDFAVDGATRMKELIHGLLDYARVGNMSADAVAVDLNQVMRDVQILLKTKIEETNAVVLTDHLPIVPRANYTQMLQLLQNLLGNALKYRSEKDPLVQVGVEDSGDTWTIYVKDNGIGFDMRYADKIFQVFQRLHQQRTFTGTGIGLSICKRIVEKMGGKIWVESMPGKGSSFFFTIVK